MPGEPAKTKPDENIEIIANQQASPPTVATASPVAPSMILPPGFLPTPAFGIGVAIQQASQAAPSFLEKMSPENYTQVLSELGNESRRRNTERILLASLGFALAGGLLITFVVICLLFLMFNHPEHLQGVLGAMIGLVSGLAGGGLGGYSIGQATAKRDK